MDALVLEEVRKTFGDVRAVDGLNVRVPAGSIYGFLGPNGAGKTTAIRMMMNIISPDSGRIQILGSDSVEQAKDRIGYMPEERGLYPRMTLQGVLAYLAVLKGMRKAHVGPAIRNWLKTVDLAGWADRKVHELVRIDSLIMNRPRQWNFKGDFFPCKEYPEIRTVSGAPRSPRAKLQAKGAACDQSQERDPADHNAKPEPPGSISEFHLVSAWLNHNAAEKNVRAKDRFLLPVNL